MTKILNDFTYAVTASSEDSTKTVPPLELCTMFRNVAAKKGVRISSGMTWGGAGIATINVDKDVSFPVFQEIMDEISRKTENSVFISLEGDFKGKRFMTYPMEEAALAVRRDCILASGC